MDPFQSQRLLYRAWEDNPKDDAFFHALLSDPLVNSMATHALQRPLSTVEKKELKKLILDETFVSFVICKIPDHNTSDQEPQAIGMISLKSTKPAFAHNRSLEFGINVAREHQGNGYGPEAISWLLDWSFMTAGLHRVELTVFEWNEKAQKVYEKLGFVHEGRRRQCLWKAGKWWDAIQMGILQHEWEAKKKLVHK